MAARAARDSRHRFGDIVLDLELVIAGAFIGLAGFILKASLMNVANIAGFLLNPVSYIAGISGLIGFLAMQKALHHRHVSIVTPVIGGISIILPVILAYLFLGEVVSILKWVGVIAIIIGVFGLK